MTHLSEIMAQSLEKPQKCLWIEKQPMKYSKSKLDIFYNNSPYEVYFQATPSSGQGGLETEFNKPIRKGSNRRENL